MRNLVAVILAVILTILIIPARGFAQGDGPLQGLDVTPAQKSKITKAQAANSQLMNQQSEQVKKNREAFIAKFGAEASDGDLRKAHAAVLDARKQVAKTQFETMLAIRNLLTPEQRKKFAEKMKSSPGRFD